MKKANFKAEAVCLTIL